ncbi:PspC domain-containing protein [Mucilaginibacter sp. AW1-3]
MNKTIIININGTVFHIEEDAYEVLKNYMTDVKRHFADAEDSLEITTDIENRIAEMFTEILNTEVKQVIVTADVNTIIAQMGTVEEFETSAADPDAVFTTHQTVTGARKLFRDPDDHLIGGVCAGIGNYFDIDTVWIRLAFGLAFILWGTGLFLYIILWIIVPKAATRADKMAMKGEKLDLQGFKNNFEQELKNVEHTVRNAHKEARPFVYKSRDFVGDLFDHLGNFIGGTGRFLLKLFGIFILGLSCFISIVLIVCLAVCLMFGQHEAWEMFHISLPYYNDSYIILISGFFIIILPLIAIIQLTLRVVFNRGLTNYRSTGYTMLIVWIMAIIFAAYYGVKIGREFSAYASFSKSITLSPTSNNTYLLTLNNAKDITRDDSLRLNLKDRFKGNITINENDYDEYNDFQQRMTLTIERSDIAQPILVESFSAHGRDYDDALLKAQNTAYHFTQQDSVLKFNRRLQNFANDPFNRQQIELTLKLPLNAKVVIDRNIKHYIQDIDINECNEINKQERPQTTTFIMAHDGLQCKVDTLPAIASPAVKP